jgi:hypothetical protein
VLAGLRREEGTGCAGARVLVLLSLRGAVVDDVTVAPELPVRQRTLAASRKAEGVQLAAAGVRAAACVAMAAAAEGTDDVTGRLALRQEKSQLA